MKKIEFNNLLNDCFSVVYFRSAECFYCKHMDFVFHKIKNKVHNNIKFIILNKDIDDDIIEYYSIDSFPTIMFFNNDNAINFIFGSVVYEENFIKEIEEYYNEYVKLYKSKI